MGVNSGGLKSKLPTLKKVLHELEPTIFCIEETKYKEPGKLKVDGYEVFELLRKDKEGGGIAIGCKKELHPTWVREGDDYVEAISINILVKNLTIRCCAAYGCQENEAIDRKEAFWDYLEEEVEYAKNSGSGFILHFDGNLWAGNSILPGDPRPQNKNGKLFQTFLSRHQHLTVVNALPICEGLITRRRIKDGVLEESALDFFVVCNLVLPHVTKMKIDEDRKYVLTNHQSAKIAGKATYSDHFSE